MEGNRISRLARFTKEGTVNKICPLLICGLFCAFAHSGAWVEEESEAQGRPPARFLEEAREFQERLLVGRGELEERVDLLSDRMMEALERMEGWGDHMMEAVERGEAEARAPFEVLPYTLRLEFRLDENIPLAAISTAITRFEIGGESVEKTMGKAPEEGHQRTHSVKFFEANGVIGRSGAKQPLFSAEQGVDEERILVRCEGHLEIGEETMEEKAGKGEQSTESHVEFFFEASLWCRPGETLLLCAKDGREISLTVHREE
jgi:hypothetical protein